MVPQKSEPQALTLKENQRGLPAVPNAAMTPMELISMAVSAGQSVEYLDKLMTLQERWQANQGRRAFDDAIAAAKAEIPVISKNKKVDFTSAKGRTNYQHEDLGEIARTVDPILAKHGLSYRFRARQEGKRIFVVCVLSHREGHFEENELSADNDESGNKNSIQAIGSTATYLQRYTLKLALGLAAAKDDDAQKAGGGKAISAAQAQELFQLAERGEADKKRFCEHFGIEGIPQLPSSKFAEAKVMLDLKVKQKARAEAAAKEQPDV